MVSDKGRLPRDLKKDLKAYCKTNSANLVGIADLQPFRKRLPIVPENLIDPYYYAISIGIRLSDDIINGILNCPTPEYAQHYRNINSTLDRLTSQVVRWIIEKGFNAEAIPASHLVDEKNLLGNISHKAVARMAGLGWQGKSLLIINPEFGPRFRLATVLTDMPLIPDKPIKNRCGNCVECVKACPESAIKNITTDSHYESRDIAIDLDKCHRRLLEFKSVPGIGNRICGICIRVCPFGKQLDDR